MKLKIENEHPDQQQEKHNAYLKAGFKLKDTRNNNGTVGRTYIKIKKKQ